jgi:hypothetical protein
VFKIAGLLLLPMAAPPAPPPPPPPPPREGKSPGLGTATAVRPRGREVMMPTCGPARPGAPPHDTLLLLLPPPPPPPIAGKSSAWGTAIARATGREPDPPTCGAPRLDAAAGAPPHDALPPLVRVGPAGAAAGRDGASAGNASWPEVLGRMCCAALVATHDPASPPPTEQEREERTKNREEREQ